MAKKQIVVQLDEELVDKLDRFAPAAEGARSELIGDAIDFYLRAVRKGTADLRSAEPDEQLHEDLGDAEALRALATRTRF